MNKKNNILTLIVILTIVAAGTGAYFYMIGQTHAVETVDIVEIADKGQDNPAITENEIAEILEIVGRDQNVPPDESKRVYYCNVPTKVTREECIQVGMDNGCTREEAIRKIDSAPQYDYKDRVIIFSKSNNTIYIKTLHTLNK